MNIPYYNEEIELIESIRFLIKSKYNDLFLAVIVHGSIATNEVIRYSDFDGLLIVKDKFVNSKELKLFKKESMRLILKFDPLQHHGWFEMKESQLLNYPENYFPICILENSKTIFPKCGLLKLDIVNCGTPDFKSGLLTIVNSFDKRLAGNWRPKNLFELKSILSQLMLLPSLFFSAKNNKGIFKKDSFEAVRIFFTSEEWYVIDISSQIRENWNYKLNNIQLKLLLIPNRLIRKVVVKLLVPKVPIEYNNLLDDKFYNSMRLLMRKLKSEIK